ncbi:helix-turn-helix domain-containing protein [Serinicoccus marinus]|uniref:helix-turn-helix domain-containing protein n=1 Tax=Serinicoccus marinus TaxID=247333 RepID=UPI0003F941E8|nr:helix-turn-helix transcriptional regulator [Serinicoccus marinus]
MSQQRYTTRQAAAAIGVPFIHLSNVLKGRVRPSDAVRERLPQLLGTSVTVLFTPEMLKEPYDSKRAARATADVEAVAR